MLPLPDDTTMRLTIGTVFLYSDKLLTNGKTIAIQGCTVYDMVLSTDRTKLNVSSHSFPLLEGSSPVKAGNAAYEMRSESGDGQ